MRLQALACLLRALTCLLAAPASTGLASVPVVSRHLSTNTLTLQDEDSLRDSARLLKRFHVTGAPVADGSSLSGILSRNDLLVAIDAAFPSDTTATEFARNIQSLQESQVWQVMASVPTTIIPDASLLTAARIMEDKKLNRLMAKSTYSSVLGVISSTDVVFALLKCDAASAAGIDIDEFTYSCAGDTDDRTSPAYDECALDTSVGMYMTKRVYVMQPLMSLKDAARLLRAADVTGAPVLDENDKLVGVISRNDLLKVLLTIPPEAEAAGGEALAEAIAQLETKQVADVMSRKSITISPQATMLEAAKLLAREKLNRLMVVEPESGDLCGVLSSTDVVFAMLGCAVGPPSDDDEDTDIDESRLGNMYRRGIY